MTQYIDKDALLAEIDKLSDNSEYHESYYCGYRDGNNDTLDALKEKIDTIEVKEVDLEKELDNYFNTSIRKNLLENDNVTLFMQFRKVAKHFFELGMQQSKNNNNEEKNRESIDNSCKRRW